MTDALAGNIFENKVQSMVVDSDQNGFTILIDKNAPRDLRYSWNAFAVKDAKVFESVIEGLFIEMPSEVIIKQVENKNPVTPSETIDTLLDVTAPPLQNISSDSSNTDIDTLLNTPPVIASPVIISETILPTVEPLPAELPSVISTPIENNSEVESPISPPDITPLVEQVPN